MRLYGEDDIYHRRYAIWLVAVFGDVPSEAKLYGPKV
jgi:hypothetical protein